jgi:hypothetical protein
VQPKPRERRRKAQFPEEMSKFWGGVTPNFGRCRNVELEKTVTHHPPVDLNEIIQYHKRGVRETSKKVRREQTKTPIGEIIMLSLEASTGPREGETTHCVERCSCFCDRGDDDLWVQRG